MHRLAITSLLLVAACAPKPAPMFEDHGTPRANPYDHHLNPGLTTGPLAGFLKIVVDPATFPAALTPKGPPMALDVAPPATVAFGEGKAVVVRVDLAALAKGKHSFDEVVAAMVTRADGWPRWLVARDQGVAVVWAASDDLTTLSKQLLSLQFGEGKPVHLKDVATVESVTELPPEIAGKWLMQNPGGPPMVSATPPRASAPRFPVHGVLPIRNPATAWTEIAVNGEKVGVAPPLATASISSVKSGQYDVSYTLPNGYSWTERTSTVTH